MLLLNLQNIPLNFFSNFTILLQINTRDQFLNLAFPLGHLLTPLQQPLQTQFPTAHLQRKGLDKLLKFEILGVGVGQLTEFGCDLAKFGFDLPIDQSAFVHSVKHLRFELCILVLQLINSLYLFREFSFETRQRKGVFFEILLKTKFAICAIG